MIKKIVPLILFLLMIGVVSATVSWTVPSTSTANTEFTITITSSGTDDSGGYKILKPSVCDFVGGGTLGTDNYVRNTMSAFGTANSLFKCSSTSTFQGEYTIGSSWSNLPSKTVTIGSSGQRCECPGGIPDFTDSDSYAGCPVTGPTCAPDSLNSNQLCTEGFNCGGFLYCDLDNIIICTGNCIENVDACIGQICNPGWMKCEDSTAKLCNSQGTDWINMDVCGNNELCIQQSTTSAICQPDNKCSIGERVCTGTTTYKECFSQNQIEIWSNDISCRVGLICVEGHCTDSPPQLCTPKEEKQTGFGGSLLDCDVNKTRTCNTAGTAWGACIGGSGNGGGDFDFLKECIYEGDDGKCKVTILTAIILFFAFMIGITLLKSLGGK